MVVRIRYRVLVIGNPCAKFHSTRKFASFLVTLFCVALFLLCCIPQFPHLSIGYQSQSKRLNEETTNNLHIVHINPPFFGSPNITSNFIEKSFNFIKLTSGSLNRSLPIKHRNKFNFFFNQLKLSIFKNPKINKLN